MEEDYRKAGKVAREALEKGAKKVKVGASLLKLAEEIEKDILDKADGLAFPVNISLNNQAAHYTPGVNDEAVFGKDVVKLDVGAHANGYIGDTALTVDLTGENGKLVEASEKALEEVIAAIKPGANTGDLGKLVQETIEGYGFKPIMNLGGHVLGQWMLHSGLTVPNVASTGFDLEEGMAIAIEPFASAGRGRVTEDRRVEIFALNSPGAVRNADARKVIAFAAENYEHFPFAERHLAGACSGLKLKIALREIVSKEIFTSYPILSDNGLVSQAEKTVIVTADGCEVTTK
ncbi:type II methionyl aminopeptidase [archaeon]